MAWQWYGSSCGWRGAAGPNFGDPSSAIYAKYSLSPDGKHVAHFAFPLQPTGNAEHGLFLDGKYTPINHGMNTKFLNFSPDSKHLAWFQAVPSTLQFRIVIDGKPVAQTEALSTLGINNDAIMVRISTGRDTPCARTG